MYIFRGQYRGMVYYRILHVWKTFVTVYLHLLIIFTNIVYFRTDIILEEVFIDLKNSKCFEEILTKSW